MSWTHYIVLAVILVAGYYLGSNHPGLITKVSGGMVHG